MTGKIGARQTVAESFVLAGKAVGPAFALAGPIALGGFGLLFLPLAVPALLEISIIGYVAVIILMTLAVAIVPQAMASGVVAPSHAIGLLGARAFWIYLGAAVACVSIPAAMAGIPASFAVSVIRSNGDELAAMAWIVLAFVVWIWLSLRLALVLPSIAAGEPFSLRRSWRLTRGNSLVLGGCLFIFLMPLSLFQHAIVKVSAGYADASLAVAVAGVLAAIALTGLQAIVYGAVTGIAFRRAAGGFPVGAA